MRVAFSQESDLDIVRVYAEGVRLFGLHQADRYHDDLFDLFYLLADNPKMAPERRDIAPPVRVHPFKAHVIVYREAPDGGILILRVRHAGEDWLERPV